MSVRIQVKKEGDAAISRTLEQLTGRLQDLTPIMSDIGEILVEHIKSNFKYGTAPDGARWRPSIRAMRDGGQTLVDTATLRNSLHARATRRSVTVGTPVAYAAVHQFGARTGAFGTVDVIVHEYFRRGRRGGEPVRVREHTRRQRVPWGDIPARPFMPDPDALPTDLSNEILDAITDRLFGA